MVKQINAVSPEWQVLGFYDDAKVKGSFVDDLPVLGSLEDLNAAAGTKAIVLAVADPMLRKRIKESIQLENVSYPALIHPSADPGDLERNRFGEGILITAANVLTTAVVVEDFSIINLGCTIGHDVTIGSFSTIMPGCSISGAVKIGTEVLIGSGARILPGVLVGDRSKVGAGAVILQDVAPGVSVVGVPGRVVKRETP